MKTAIAGIIIVVTYAILLLVVAICSPGCVMISPGALAPAVIPMTVDTCTLFRSANSGTIVDWIVRENGKWRVTSTDTLEEFK
jgi:hypothetical protein